MSLTLAEKSLLVKGLSFPLPAKQLTFSDHLINFELFHSIKDAALTSFRNSNANVPQKLSNKEFEALKSLSKNSDLFIQKADEGSS